MAKILVIDDDSDLLAVFGEFLKILNWDADLCCDAAAGLDKAVTGEYEVVLCDQNMPRWRGSQIAEEIHRKSPRTRVILSTGDAGDDELVEVAASTGAEITQKPLTFETLEQMLGDERG